MKEFDHEMWQDFQVEVEENLEEFEPNLLLLEQQPDDSSILNDCFRNMHSIKGAANYMGLSGIASLAHAVENLFDMARQGHRELSQDAFDLIFRCIDRFKALLRAIGEHHEETLEVNDLLEEIKAAAHPEKQSEAVQKSGEKPEESAGADSEEDQELLSIFAMEMESLLEQMSRVMETDNVEPQTLDLVLQDMERMANYMGKEKLYSAVKDLRNEISGLTSEDLTEDFRRDFASRLRAIIGSEVDLHGMNTEIVSDFNSAETEEDGELYTIFLDFFRETGSPLANIPDKMDEQWMTDCQEAVNRLKTSANYMDYMEVVHILEEWEECIAEQLSGGKAFDPSTYTALWERLCDRLPNLEALFGEAGHKKDQEHETEFPDEKDKEIQTKEGLKAEAEIKPDSLDDFDSAIDSIFEDSQPAKAAAQVDLNEEVAVSGSDQADAKAMAEIPAMAANFPEFRQISQPQEKAAEPSPGSKGQMVRVNLEKVENLLEDVAELVVLKSSMGQ
ncbi:MAG: hypothetical protein DSZ23_03455, partial [Thermodesulfatator sp.]